MTERRKKPQQNYKLGAAVRHSGLFPTHLGAKMILAELCNFSVIETGKGWCYNAPLGNVAGVKVKQVGRIKRKLEDENFVTFSHVKGKGRHTDFTLNIEAIQQAMELAPGINEAPFTASPYTPLGGGVTPPAMGVKPPLAGHLTPPSGSHNPPSRRDPIGNKNIKTCAHGARMGDNAPDGGEPRDAAGELIRTPAEIATREALSTLGHNWARQNLVDRFFIMDAGRVVARVAGLSGKASVAEAVKSLSMGHEIAVIVAEQDERADA